MNFLELQERVWVFLGCQETGARRAWRAQLIREALNNAQNRIANTAPYIFNLVRESSISVVAGTTEYYGDDWVKRFISFYMEGTQARKVYYRHPSNVDRDGSRGSGFALGDVGPFEVVWIPRSTSAVISGTAASATEGTTSVTGVSGLGVASLYVNRMLILNGDGNDYKITAHNDTTITVDKAIKGKVSGESTTLTGTGYSSVKWEIGPPKRQKIKLIGTPGTSATVKYRAVFYPRRMLLDNDVPEIDDDWHHLIWKGALEEVEAFNNNAQTYQLYQAQYMQGLEELKRADADMTASEDTPAYESSEDRRTWVPGLYDRGD